MKREIDSIRVDRDMVHARRVNHTDFRSKHAFKLAAALPGRAPRAAWPRPRAPDPPPVPRPRLGPGGRAAYGLPGGRNFRLVLLFFQF